MAPPAHWPQNLITHGMRRCPGVREAGCSICCTFVPCWFDKFIKFITGGRGRGERDEFFRGGLISCLFWIAVRWFIYDRARCKTERVVILPSPMEDGWGWMVDGGRGCLIICTLHVLFEVEFRILARHSHSHSIASCFILSAPPSPTPTHKSSSAPNAHPSKAVPNRPPLVAQSPSRIPGVCKQGR